MRILFIGEIVAKPGRQAVAKVLPKIIKKHKPDFIVANVENIAHGRGVTAKTIKEMQELGIDFFTGGDHMFWHDGFEDQIDTLPIVRPANYPSEVKGKGYDVVDVGDKKVLVISLMSQPFINESLNNPFVVADEILNEYANKNLDAIIVDFHAEFTSDKYAMGFYLDGRVDGIIGTHTHVPTCDEQVLPKGTMYVSDVGMCGSRDSILGVKKEIIIDRVVHSKKQRFVWEEEGRQIFRSVLLDTTKKEIKRLDEEIT
jgi:metallophosphoesterase (TIGR00282 family)